MLANGIAEKNRAAGLCVQLFNDMNKLLFHTFSWLPKELNAILYNLYIP